MDRVAQGTDVRMLTGNCISHMCQVYLKRGFDSVQLQLLQVGHVLLLHKFVSIHSRGFVKPQSYKVHGCLDTVRSCKQNSL